MILYPILLLFSRNPCQHTEHLAGVVVVEIGGVVRTSARAGWDMGDVGVARGCVGGRHGGGGEGQGQGGQLVQWGVDRSLDRQDHRLDWGGKGAVLVQQVRLGLLQLHLGGGHGGEGAGLLQQARPLLAQLGRGGGLERGGEGLQLV